MHLLEWRMLQRLAQGFREGTQEQRSSRWKLVGDGRSPPQGIVKKNSGVVQLTGGICGEFQAGGGCSMSMGELFVQ